jgi:hypothetical protein
MGFAAGPAVVVVTGRAGRLPVGADRGVGLRQGWITRMACRRLQGCPATSQVHTAGTAPPSLSLSWVLCAQSMFGLPHHAAVVMCCNLQEAAAVTREGRAGV